MDGSDGSDDSKKIDIVAVESSISSLLPGGRRGIDIEENMGLMSSSSNSYADTSTEMIGGIAYLEDLPQGRHLGVFSTIILFVSRIVGSGIFATPAGIYNDVGGSPALFFLAWILAALSAFSGLYIYLEMGSLVPRSGGTKVFLEFVYDRPKMLITVIFSVYSVAFGFTISNAIVFGSYALYALGFDDPTDIQSRYVGLGLVVFATIIHGCSVRHGVMIQNIIGGLKLALLGVMILTGLYVIVFPSSVSGIPSQLHLHNFFEVKRSITSSTFAGAIIKASFSFAGWNSVHTVASEIEDPVRTLKIAGPASLIFVSISYLFTNLAYLIVIPDEEIVGSGQLVGSLLFEKILGHRLGRQFLTFSIAVCAGGNVFVVVYSISRMSQEVFREGILPFSDFMASNWPFGAPFPTLLLSCFLSALVLLGPPPGDVYNYIISFEGYPVQVFTALVSIGIFIVRKKYPEVKSPIRCSQIGTIFVTAISIYLCIAPFVGNESPNPKGLENWPSYATAAVLSLVGCGMYWFVIFKLFPWIWNYRLIREDRVQSDGLIVKNWIKIYY